MTLAAAEPRDVPWTGYVVACEAGVAVVRTDRGDVRATYSGRMLARLARDRRCAAQAGDQVVLRRWPDNVVTIEEVCPLAANDATVIELRRH